MAQDGSRKPPILQDCLQDALRYRKIVRDGFRHAPRGLKDRSSFWALKKLRKTHDSCPLAFSLPMRF
eukprot:9404532-Pyramimonas_sp.AAC.1